MGLLDLVSWCSRYCLGQRKQHKQQLTPGGNPLPETVHLVLKPEDLGPGRLIIIGDVHGCYDVLLELLRKVKYQPRHDNLILVGDLVDKGPKSQQTVAAARAWCEGSYCWVVRGNHDDQALAANLFLARGGTQNELNPKFNWVNELLPEDVDFLLELPFTIRVEGYNIVVVHAALLPGVPIEAQGLGVCMLVRDVLQTPGGRWMGFEQPEEGTQAWADCWQGPYHVFFGHDAKRNLQDTPCATGLDTGCVYGRLLTACVLPPVASYAVERDAASQPGPNNAPKGSKQQAADASTRASVPSGTSSGASCSSTREMQGAFSSSAQRSRIISDGGRQLQSGHHGHHDSGTMALPLTPSLQQLRGELHSVVSTVLYNKDKDKKEKDKKDKKDKDGKKEKKKRFRTAAS